MIAYVPNSFWLCCEGNFSSGACVKKALSISIVPQLSAPCGCNNEVGDKFYACMQSEFAPACVEKYPFYYSKGGTLKLCIKTFSRTRTRVL